MGPARDILNKGGGRCSGWMLLQLDGRQTGASNQDMFQCQINSAWSRSKPKLRPFKVGNSCRSISEQTRGKDEISKDRLNPDALAEPKLRCNHATHAREI